MFFPRTKTFDHVKVSLRKLNRECIFLKQKKNSECVSLFQSLFNRYNSQKNVPLYSSQNI